MNEQEFSDFIYDKILLNRFIVEDFDCYTAKIFDTNCELFRDISGRWTLEFEPTDNEILWTASQRGTELMSGTVDSSGTFKISNSSHS